ncbi:CU044_2847 family protein [Streptomyces sp. NPDC090306]|uniref:CU044_2847 family protein n=1 Tax=Streptomyces sp. NPDC090306 TaxID=3365961 RepID=UPI003800E5E3
MTELTRFQVAGAEPVIVETDGPDGPRPASGRRPVREAHAEFTARLDAIGDAVAVSLQTLRGSLRPDGMTVTFGVTMSAEAGAVIARTVQEATFQVEMVWSRDRQGPAGSTGTGS